jgi:restriction endonuclease S subunit
MYGYTYFKENDVLIAKITPCFENGKAGIATNLTNGIGFGSTEFFILRPSKDILPHWIYLFLTDNKFLSLGKLNMTGSAGQQRVATEFLKNYKIPLPKISIQDKIISKIMEEQKLVNGNKKLIEIFEQKIKDKISEVWGE